MLALPVLFPHMLGIALGFAAMLLLVSFGNGIFNACPVSHQILKYLSLAYLDLLAIKIALSGKRKYWGF